MLIHVLFFFPQEDEDDVVLVKVEEAESKPNQTGLIIQEGKETSSVDHLILFRSPTYFFNLVHLK